MVSYTKYFIVSAAAASAVLYHAFATRQHFYPTAVYLSTSKLAVAVVGNLAFATALLLHKALIKIFLGSLRDIEQELIRERLSSAIMESLLALTIFREEFSGFFVAMFAGLVFVKVLHWLVQDRVDYIEVTPSVSGLQHVRIVAFMSVLLALDAMFLQYTVSATIASGGQSVMLLFAFEYVIQASDVIRYFVKYVLSMLDLWLEGRWESKGTCVFYLDLITDLLHLFVYVVFFVIVFTNYGLPLHLVRDLYSTFRNFRNRVMDFLRFRQVSARLDRLPDASAEDLTRSDGVCIICREEMTASGSNKKLLCGHVFHTHCLRSWLERQQNCPTCRGAVFQRRTDPAAAGRAAPPAAAAAPNPPAALGAGPGAAAAPAPAVAGPAPPAANGVAPGAAAAAAAPPHAGYHAPQHRVRLVHRTARAPADAPPAAAGAAGAGPSNPLMQFAGQPVPGMPGANQNPMPGWGLPPHLAGQLPNLMGQFPFMGPQQLPGEGIDVASLNLAALLGGRGFNMPLGMPGMVPLFPTLMPPLTPPPAANSVLEQQAAAAAAAAALAAAAAVGAFNPLGGLMWMPTPRPQPAPAADTSSSHAAASSAQATGSGGPSAGPSAAAEEDAMVRLGRLAAELNTVLTEINVAKQEALAKQVAEQVQVAMAAAQAVLASTTAPVQPPAAAATQPATPAPAGSSQGTDTAPQAGAAVSSSSVTNAAFPPAAATGPFPATPPPAFTSTAEAATSSSAQPTSVPAAPAQQPDDGKAAGPSSSPALTQGTAGSSSGAEADAEQDEIRRKRLARFGQQ